MEAHRDVVRVGEAEDMVDELGRGAVVLVDLEADRARVEERLERGVVRGPRVRLEADVERPALEAAERPLHRRRRLVEAGGDQRRHAGGQRRGEEVRADRVDVRVDGAGRGDQAVGGDRGGVRPDREVDPLGDAGVPGPADPRRSGRP